MKRKILVFAAFYSPAVKGGGPIQSIKNLVDNLSDENDFYIITSDRDLGDHTPFSDINFNTWVNVGNAHVCYLDTQKTKLSNFISLINSVDYDLIYLNSFFSFRYSILPIILYKTKYITVKPIILAPRGEFSLGALKLKKTKKNLYIFLAKLLSMYNNVLWQGTASEEKNDILRVFGEKANVMVASNLTADYSGLEYTKNIEKNRGSIKIIFLSRIHPKKNLKQALLFLSKVNGKVEFNIYGPIEDTAYWTDCEEIISNFPPNILVSYKGVVKHEDIIEIFREHHIFLFPTLGENFGHVIFEALIGGCPLIISDQTPWRNLEGQGIGFDIELSNDNKFIEKIQYFIEMSKEELEIYSKKSFYFGKNYSRKNNSYLEMKNILSLFD